MNQELITLPTGTTAALSAEQLETMGKKSSAMQAFSQSIFKFEVAEALHIQSLPPVLPTTVADIPDAEKALSILKDEYNACEERTKEFTDPLNGVIDRLNGYKKRILDERTEKGKKIRSGYIAELEGALLPLKQQELVERAKKQQRDQELHNFRLQCVNALADSQTKAKMLIEQLKTSVYKHALDKVAVVNIGAFIVSCRQNTTEDAFIASKPFHCNDLEKEAIVNEIFASWNPQAYADAYHAELGPLFADFANAKENASVAAERQRQAEMAKTLEVAEQGGQAKAAAAIQAAASPMPDAAPSIATKELKSLWKVDMPDDWNTVLELMKAYSVAQAAVQGKLRVGSIWSLSMQQLANALSAIKNDDPNFAPQGIIFTQVNKL